MKKTFLTATLIFYALLTFSQQERKTSIEFDTRASFLEVDNTYQPKPDIIYHANPGFRIFPNYDTIKIDQIEYVIFKYPRFNNGQQVFDDPVRRGSSVATTVPIHQDLYYSDTSGKFFAYNGKTLAMKKADFDALDKIYYYSLDPWVKRNYTFSSGVMTVPFKLRPKIDTTEFNLTTDITLGGYFGLTKRISATKRFYLTLPLTLGLSYININDNTTSNVSSGDIIGVVPGITWSTGLIFQLEDFNIGVVLGKDYASSVGDNWLYNKKIWYSFAIGYNFLAQD